MHCETDTASSVALGSAPWCSQGGNHAKEHVFSFVPKVANGSTSLQSFGVQVGGSVVPQVNTNAAVGGSGHFMREHEPSGWGHG